jgi:hypothetical protein
MLQRFSRRTWVVAIVASVLCVGALGFGLVRYWDHPPTSKTIPREVTHESNGGFVLGLILGVGVGLAIAGIVAVRKRD